MSIVIKDLSYTYMQGTPYQKRALDRISMEIRDGEILGIIGSTGSGKSTFIQHLNGLLKPQSGTVVAYGVDLSVKKPDYKKVRSVVGMVFQYPEYQLFEETVAKDVAFGPKNQKKSPEEIDKAVRESIAAVGLDYDVVAGRSPYELSGGQKRRVALAGILAMRPKTLILDEPTCGLDPLGKRDILRTLRELRDSRVVETIVIISHDMDEISSFADRIAVFHASHLLCVKPTAELFEDPAFLRDVDLDIPVVAELKIALRQHGIEVPSDIICPDDFVDFCIKTMGRV